jgi:hypothetical protein
MPTKKAEKSPEAEWEQWGEDFGKRMEARFASPHKVKRNLSIGGLLFALFLLTWGAIWLGNDLGYWQAPFPFWPILIILVGLGMLLSAIRKVF